MLDRLLERSAGFAERSAVGGTLAFPVGAFFRDAAFAHNGVTDDERRAVLLCFGFDDGLANSVRVVARNLLHIPSPGIVLGRHIFGCHFTAARRELDGVGVVEHDQIVQPEVSCQTACTLRYLFLYAAVGDEGIDGRIMNSAVTGVEPLGSDGSSYSEGMSLSERSGGVLYHPLYLALRVSGRYRTPLTEVLQVFERELTSEAELSVEHRRHVTRIEEEAVTRFPARILRVVFQKLAKEDIDEVRATHSSARVTTLSFLYCCCGQDSDVVRRAIQKLCLVHSNFYINFCSFLGVLVYLHWL